eukprot:CAMPEP_0184694862 /NCGR_PEP_ID=MMETSP0313-20130426/2684_1 /TAXON_ID=2792 /ORGANISM="Porphyridium aerugineum, Strain SAG 1380-2" /LENGTH=256 /DNA_ID=CAMNT_0027153221 /DNA_START=778 /DNA_END=1548 /DNA_ORIENTATION=+
MDHLVISAASSASTSSLMRTSAVFGSALFRSRTAPSASSTATHTSQRNISSTASTRFVEFPQPRAEATESANSQESVLSQSMLLRAMKSREVQEVYGHVAHIEPMSNTKGSGIRYVIHLEEQAVAPVEQVRKSESNLEDYLSPTSPQAEFGSFTALPLEAPEDHNAHLHSYESEVVSSKQIVRAMKKFCPFLMHANGGVTVRAAFAQPEFSAAILQEARKLGLHTCVETDKVVSDSRLTEFADQIVVADTTSTSKY